MGYFCLFKVVRIIVKVLSFLLLYGLVFVGIVSVLKSYVYHKWPLTTREDNFVARSINFFNNQRRCKPQKNILFAKLHKTGSSTMTNIFNRFADIHNLTVALPLDGYYTFLWPLPFQTDFVKNVHHQPNILCNHARYNLEPLRQLMPVETQYVTVLRNPITQYPSLYKFMDLESILNLNLNQKNISMEYFIDNSYNILKTLHRQNSQALIDNPTLYLLRNPQLFDLGFSPSFSEDDNRIRLKITEIANHFKVVLIMEYFDESLVLLKRKMCWDLDDVVYFKHNKHIMKNEISQDLQKKILRWTKADVTLYNHFNKSFWNNIKSEGLDFWEEVALLRQKNKELTEACLKRGRFLDRAYTGSFSIIYGHALKSDIPPHLKNVCKRMIRPEIKYIDYFRTIYSTAPNLVKNKHKSSVARY